MGDQLRWVGLALLTPVLGCGARAESSHRGSRGAWDGAGESADPSAASGGEGTRTPDEGASGAERARASCGPDRVFRESLEIRDQTGLDRLSGCERLEGVLVLHPFEGMDDAPLSSLRVVDGSVTVAGGSGVPVRDPLAGFRSLEQVGALTVMDTAIQNLAGLGALERADQVQLSSNQFLSSLAGLSRLQSIGGLSIAGSPALASFRGLGAATLQGLSVSGVRQLSLEGLESVTISGGLQLSGVAQLSAPSGAPHLGGDVWLEIDASPELQDVQAFAGVTALRALRLYRTGIENLDALSSLVELSFLDLYDNPRLQQIDGLGAVQHVTQIRISENPALTSLAGLGALREVGGLQVEHNSALVELALPQLTEASIVVVHRNAALDDTALAGLGSLPAPAIVKIASNGSGPSRLDPCPWTGDGVCDESPGDCAAGSDTADCGGLSP